MAESFVHLIVASFALLKNVIVSNIHRSISSIVYPEENQQHSAVKVYRWRLAY